MTKTLLLLQLLLIGAIGLVQSTTAWTKNTDLDDPYARHYIVPVTLAQDTIPLKDRKGDFVTDPGANPFDLKDPSIIEKNVEYDPASNQYIITEKIGDDYFRSPTYMSFEEYLDYRAKQQQQDYFKELAGVSSGDRGASGRVDPLAKFNLKNNMLDRLFGGNQVDIRPQGNIDLTFGLDYQSTENPILPIRQRRILAFDFDMGIQMNVTGKIGEKLTLSTNYNTQATFDFDNQMKLNYNSDAFSEDDIIKKVEAGNVSLPLRGSLIQGAQSLFGLKTELQFGHLRVTGIASQQRSQRKDIVVQGGSQEQIFEVTADQYDENRHFLLSHYNRNTFEENLTNLPQIKGVFRIEQIEVWITNDRNEVNEIMDIVALADLGEPNRDKMTNDDPRYQPPVMPRYLDITGQYGLPDNAANPLYAQLRDDDETRKIDNSVNNLTNRYRLQTARDFEKVTARRLKPTEYTFHPELGFVSINVNVRPDQVLGVAYQYSYNGQLHKVGEFFNEVASNGVDSSFNVLYVKMLKSTTTRIDVPYWDLMMKNVYSIGAYQVNPRDFRLDIFYEDPGRGIKRFLPETNLQGVPLLRVFNLDTLNTQGDPQPDGVFDFVPGVTINPRNGRIMFPVLEPFGASLDRKLVADQATKRKYLFTELYDSTVTKARERAEFNRYTIKGSFKSSVSSEISLGAFNVPRGSVRVSAGGQQLIEGRDYEIDYSLGRVRILNDAFLSSGAPIRVSFEDNALFGLQTKTLMGLRADYEVGENLNIGATYLHLFERPFTQKVNIGDDPINNRIIGLDVNFSKEAPWLTRLVDKIPLIQTKAPSSVAFSAETAFLRPGHSRAINEPGDQDKSGTVYIDDFEGSQTGYDLRQPANEWVLASVPQNDANNNNPIFPEASLVNDVRAGANRALINWYRLDPSARSSADADNPYTSTIDQNEIFKLRQPIGAGIGGITDPLANIVQALDVVYYPEQRGPYNFDVPNGFPGYTAGLSNEGRLERPETRWGGIMRDLNTNDFEQANIEFIEFWLLSPFLLDPDDPEKEGDIYLNIGNISEDILRDSRKFYENGLPGPNTPDRRTDRTNWARIPVTRININAFDVDEETRQVQDVGLDGLDNDGERQQFADYLQAISGIRADARDQIAADPSNDDFVYYRDESFTENDDLQTRYRRFNNPEGNSRPPQNSNDQLRTAGTNYPDSEDINRDNTLNETESYFQYRIPIRSSGREIDMASNPYIIDRVEADQEIGGVRRVWYRFKIPLDDPTRKAIGGIQDFRSIRFLRMYMKGFRKPVTMRFARFELGRNQWRRYSQPLDRDVEPVVDDDVTTFDVNGIGIEENSQRLPFNYVLPVGIQREQAIGIIQGFQNEQALSMRVCNLRDGDSKAIFKNTRLDMRVYKRMKMFVHAEASDDKIIEPGELSLFIRVGSDFRNNYYEYEVPLTMSDPNVLPPGPSNRDNDEYKREVWRQENEFDFPLSLLTTIKELRNLDQTSLTQEYSKLVTDLINEENKENHRIKIKGNPNTGLVKSVLIGVRNRRDKSDSYCAEVWVNELRLTGLDERGGMAALARLDLQLADFGNVTLSGNYGSIGFGALDQRLAQRAREQSMEYGVATNLELGKFLPEKTGIHIPFYAQYSKNIRVPEFDPYDLDLNFQRKVDTADPAVRDSLLDQALIVTTVKSYNFTNVRKDRTKTGKPMPWDISNFGFTYAYNQTLRSDPLIESDDVENYRAAIDYGFQIQPKYITPFKGLIKKDKWFKLLTDFNFNPLPNSFGVSTIMDRQFAVTKYRFTGVLEQYNTFFNKRFTWDRIYDLQWDLSRALKLDFTANANSVKDEPREFNENLGRFITDTERRDSIWQNVRDFGRMKNYTHSINASYTLPLKQFPLLDWITVRAQYAGNYSWNAAALNTTSLGNVIQNGQNRQVNGEFNFESLYNKWAFLRKINNPGRATNTRNQPRTPERTRQNNTDAPDDNPSNATAKKDDKKKKDAEPAPITRALIRPLMALRRARLNYTETFSTIVPGFTPTSQWLGMSNGFDAPGWDFVAGWQPNIRQWQPGTTDDWLANAANQGWITNDILLNQQVLQNYSQNYDGRITIEPFRDFRIEVEANKQFTENHSQYFKDTLNDGVNDWVHAVPRNFGSMTVSYFAMNTIFKDSNEDIIGLFNQFQANRITISQRLGSGVHGTDQEALQGYTQGYGRAQQEVVIPAFIAAYTKQDASKVSLDIFKTMPRLNWRVTYNGLSRLPLFKEIFQSVNISHGYRSTLTINQFYTGTNYLADPGGLNLDQNYYARIEIPEVVISEQFSPLLAVDVTTKNNMSFKLDFRKARTLGFSFVGNQLSQTQTSEYIVGFGYKMQNVRLSFLPGYQSTKPANNRGRNANTQDPGDQSDTVNPRNSRSQGSQRNRGGQQGGGNDLDLKFDFSLRDDITLIQPLDESGFEPTRGTWALRINPQAQYQLNKRLILIFFVNYTRTVPKVSSSFPITNSQGGVTVRFSLN